MFINCPLNFINWTWRNRFYTGCIKKSRQFRNGSQPYQAASSMKFFGNIDCLGICDVE